MYTRRLFGMHILSTAAALGLRTVGAGALGACAGPSSSGPVPAPSPDAEPGATSGRSTEPDLDPEVDYAEVNTALTITALAERNIETIAREDYHV